MERIDVVEIRAEILSKDTSGVGRGAISRPISEAWPASGERSFDIAPRAVILPHANEVFRSIYTRALSDSLSVLGVTSAIAGEGKTTVSLGLATTFAQDFPDRRVLVIETDLDRPVLATDFKLEASPGLVDCLLNCEVFQASCRNTFMPNLDLLPSGRSEVSTGRLLRSRRMAMVIERARQIYDFVILDIPAILANSDAVPVTNLVDSVICVVRSGVTPMPVVESALEHLDGTKISGALLNDVHSAIPNWLRRFFG